MAAIGAGIGPAWRADRGAGFDFTGPALPPGAVLTRRSAAGVIDAAGRRQVVPPDVARFDHSFAGQPRGLLIEPAAANALTDSDAMLGGAGWLPGIAGFWTASVADMTTLPPGPASAIRLVSAGTDVLAIRKYSIAVAGTVTVAADLYVPSQPGRPRVQICHDLEDADDGIGPVIDTVDRWVRTAATMTAAATRSFLDFDLYVGGGYSPPGFTLFLAAPQIEAGGSATSYITSGDTAGARAADLLMLDWRSRGVADGAVPIRYGFDDGSTQVAIAAVTGGHATVPTTLARPWLRSATRA